MVLLSPQAGVEKALRTAGLDTIIRLSRTVMQRQLNSARLSGAIMPPAEHRNFTGAMSEVIATAQWLDGIAARNDLPATPFLHCNLCRGNTDEYFAPQRQFGASDRGGADRFPPTGSS